jgi:hypothetical protein
MICSRSGRIGLVAIADLWNCQDADYSFALNYGENADASKQHNDFCSVFGVPGAAGVVVQGAGFYVIDVK